LLLEPAVVRRVALGLDVGRPFRQLELVIAQFQEQRFERLLPGPEDDADAEIPAGDAAPRETKIEDQLVPHHRLGRLAERRGEKGLDRQLRSERRVPFVERDRAGCRIDPSRALALRGHLGMSRMAFSDTAYAGQRSNDMNVQLFHRLLRITGRPNGHTPNLGRLAAHRLTV
jgi:hypothetical protein